MKDKFNQKLFADVKYFYKFAADHYVTPNKECKNVAPNHCHNKPYRALDRLFR